MTAALPDLQIAPLDAKAMAAARTRLDSLTKPPGSLGRLEELAIWLSGVTGEMPPSFPRKTVLVAAADHGVAAGGVSAYPQAVTAEMLRNFLRAGAAINVMARAQGARVVVVDAGVATEVAAEAAPATRYLVRRIGPGTADMRHGPAMAREDAQQALETGRELIDMLIDDGLDILATGDMGIGNTTAAAAVTAAVTSAHPDAVVGRGTGVDEAGLRRKREAVAQSLKRNQPEPSDAVDVLAKVGGYEIGVLAGAILGAAARRVPVLLDGFISGAAALLADRLDPLSRAYMVAAHRSAEPGHATVLQHLGLEPYLALEMRLGEGTGAVLAFALVEAAARVLAEMATFEEAGVSGPAD